MTLNEFLLARIAEDEDELGVLQTRDESAGPNGLGWAGVGAISEVLMISHRRALAECEAKRRIVAQCSSVLTGRVYDPEDGAMWMADAVLRVAALPYADHPDYREDWRA